MVKFSNGDELVDKEKRGDNKCVGGQERMIQPITWLVLV